MESGFTNVSMDEIRERLAANLRALRAERGVSQERLALEAGVDRTMLSKIERKISNPSIETLLKLANRLSVDLHWLLRPGIRPQPTKQAMYDPRITANAKAPMTLQESEPHSQKPQQRK